MNRTAISAWAPWRLLVDGTCTCAGGRPAFGFDSTIVRIDTNASRTGWGEYAPLGSYYNPAAFGDPILRAP